MEKHLKARDSIEDLLWPTIATNLNRLELPKRSVLAGFYRYKKKLTNYTVFLFIKRASFSVFIEIKTKKVLFQNLICMFFEDVRVKAEIVLQAERARLKSRTKVSRQETSSE